ncbi:MAG: LDCC motif putative metal-binding protein [Bacillota bacterium]
MADSPKAKKETWFSRFLDNLAKANERQFHGQVPDCCGGKKATSSPAGSHNGSMPSKGHAHPS